MDTNSVWFPLVDLETWQYDICCTLHTCSHSERVQTQQCEVSWPLRPCEAASSAHCRLWQSLKGGVAQYSLFLPKVPDTSFGSRRETAWRTAQEGSKDMICHRAATLSISTNLHRTCVHVSKCLNMYDDSSVASRTTQSAAISGRCKLTCALDQPPTTCPSHSGQKQRTATSQDQHFVAHSSLRNRTGQVKSSNDLKKLGGRVLHLIKEVTTVLHIFKHLQKQLPIALHLFKHLN